MVTEEYLRFARVLGEAFDLGERMSAHDGFSATRLRACRTLADARRTIDGLGDEPANRIEARADVAHALVALLTLAGQLGLDDTLTDVDRIVREFNAGLDRRLA